MDLFNEFIVQRRKGSREHGLIVLMFLGAMLLIFTLMMFAQNLGSFFLLLVAAVIYLLYIGVTSFNVEYEYSVTNGDLDIDKIVSRRKRSKLVSIHARSFEYFAPCNDGHKAAYDDATVTKKLDLTSNSGTGREYFAIYFKNSEKVRVAFEPTQKMIDDFARYVPRRVFHTQ